MTPLRVRIRELRQAAELSQESLGELAGVRQATISGLESGKAKRIDLLTLERLATALKVEPGDLIERVKRARR